MTLNDLVFVQKLIANRLLLPPVLELGAGYGGSTCREIVQAAELEYKTTDLHAGPGVDFIADFEDNACIEHFPGTFGSVLVLNVLEHAFEPIKVLNNAVDLCVSGGTIVTITPCVWPVHNFPRDCQRLLPDWYLIFAERNKQVRLLDDGFEFLGYGPIASFARGGELHLPPSSRNEIHDIYSRIAHKLLRTSGRGKWTANHVAIGAVFQKL